MTAPDKLFDFAYPDEVNIRSYNPPVEPSDSQVQRAVNAILSAKKPVLYAGGGAISSNASNELWELNEILKAPVTNTLMGLGVYPASDKYFLGMLGMHGTYQANMAMHNSDLIIAIGARFDDRITNTPSLFAPNAKIIHLDIDYSSVSKIIEANIALFGEVKNSLRKIISLLKENIRSV
jgi:acetolactate synthase-1/2/3 large subunit